MDLILYQNIRSFLQANRLHLEKDRISNHLILGYCYNARENGTGHGSFMAVIDGSQHVCCCLTDHLGKMLIGHCYNKIALKILAESFHSRKINPIGFVATTDTADLFAGAWTSRTGQEVRQAMNQRLYRLRSVEEVSSSPGCLRIAGKRDAEIIHDWFVRLHEEVLPWLSTNKAGEMVESLLSQKAFFIWENGVPVTMIAKIRPMDRDISVGWVYTPPEQRGKGYATTCTAAFSRLLLSEEWLHCWLFTDLANPTSNKIYSRIGYKPVQDFREYLVQI